MPATQNDLQTARELKERVSLAFLANYPRDYGRRCSDMTDRETIFVYRKVSSSE